MIKTIEVAGIRLDNYTVREAIMNVEKNVVDHGFHTIEEVNIDMLMMAFQDETVRGALERTEFTVIAEHSILEVLKASDYQRRHEIEHRDFFLEMMKRIERNHKKVFLIGEETADTETVRTEILEQYPRCEIVGAEALQECQGATDNVVNLINSIAPDVIISILPSPKQEYFLMQYRDKLSAGLWYGIGGARLSKKKRGLRDILQDIIRVHKFEKQVRQYHDSDT